MKQIPGFENHYSISMEGEVYSLKKKLPYKLAPCLGSNGYHYVNLWVQGKCFRESVHRLMAQTYLEFISSLQVNHINGVKTDNRLGNLEMCTKSHNAKHAYSLGLSVPRSQLGELNNNAKLSNTAVGEIRNLLENTDLTHKEIALRYNVSRGLISSISRREVWITI